VFESFWYKKLAPCYGSDIAYQSDALLSVTLDYVKSVTYFLSRLFSTYDAQVYRVNDLVGGERI